MIYRENDYLAHYGIKGQKWGVRRFQNKDGSLTNAGRKKTSTKKVSKRVQKAQIKFANKAKTQSDMNFHNAKSVNRLIKDNIDEGGLTLDKETKNAYSHEARRSIESGQKWLQTRNDIMNMRLSEVSVKDIKNRYKDTYRKGGAVWYPFY